MHALVIFFYNEYEDDDDDDYDDENDDDDDDDDDNDDGVDYDDVIHDHDHTKCQTKIKLLESVMFESRNPPTPAMHASGLTMPNFSPSQIYTYQ